MESAAARGVISIFVEATIYLEVGQQWTRTGQDAPVRLIGTRDLRWVIENEGGEQRELPASELRANYRFIELN